MPTPDDELRLALRALLLPIDPACEDEAIAGARAALNAAGIDEVDQAQFLRVHTSAWRETGVMHDALRDVAQAAIAAGDSETGAEVSTAWPLLVTDLTASRAMTLQEAVTFLSHLRLMMHLAANETMSAAQIARIISARDHRVVVTWQAVQQALVRLKVKPSVEKAAVEALWAADAEHELDVFADADLVGAAMQVAELCEGLRFPVPVAPLLLRLFPANGEPFAPYLQILHYQCVLAEFYDHAVATLYEFAPRGVAAKWLFERYPAAIAPAADPFLNNAKAVDQLDTAWAQTRADETGAARALVELIAGLQAMGFAARKEAAAWLRWWLHRGLRLQVPAATQLSATPSIGSVAAALVSISAAETNTGGIIEQRIVDAVASTRHAQADGWRPRGLCDSVNASNISRRKLGDCDFQHAVDRRVVAYEAHAGLLTTVYLDGHLQTLRRILASRAEEWAGISDVVEWSLTVVFVAHAFGPGVTERGGWVDPELGIPIALEFLELADMIHAAPSAAELVGPFGDLVHAPLNERRTPESVRARYAQLSMP